MTQEILRLAADWFYERCGVRCHYVIECWLGDALAGRAYGWFEPGAHFVLEKIEIDESVRSKGYGSLMIDAMRAKARESACTVFVIKGVRETNHRAIRWYQAMGAQLSAAAEGLCEFVISLP